MSTVEALAKRYAEILPNEKQFLDYATRPARSVAWRNPLAVSQETLSKWMKKNCPEATQLSWMPDAWRLPVGCKPGRWPIYFSGWVYVQDETSLLASTMLGARPGENVLDLCAAPGGKSVRAATMMGDQGTLIANELNGGRIVSLRRSFERMLVTCAAVTHGNGMQYPQSETPFDRVIADVPCTCEGTSRKQSLRSPSDSERFRASINQTQKALLRHALKLCRAGGTILYATCTYAPEENEMVIDACRYGDDFEVVPLDMPKAIEFSHGVTEWSGRTLRADLCHAVRLWPHQNDTGGFFFACLRKI